MLLTTPLDASSFLACIPKDAQHRKDYQDCQYASHCFPAHAACLGETLSQP
jgi:hypothetical protein